MKRKLFISFIFIVSFSLRAQESLNLNLLSNFTYDNSLSDVWGYTANDGEYALVGVHNGISIVEVTDPTSPDELAFFPGDVSIWRDLKTWGEYLYCINETWGGLQIVNLTEVIEGEANPTYIENMDLGFNTAHNIYIDQEGILYVFGSDYGNGGCLLFDLTVDPENPIFLGAFDDYYLHDGMVRGDTLWGGAVYNGVFSVVDVTDKSNPQLMASHETPNTFSHNCWISDDGNYLFTTDEVSGAYVAAYDVSDLNNIQELDRIQAWSGYTDVIPHNTHVNGDFIVTSYYTDGLSVVDVSHPSNMVEVAYFDTSIDYDGTGFNGAWGAYPWLPSGNILVTDIETGLYVLEPKYTNASFLEGVVVDDQTGLPISNASISIVGENGITYTDLGGLFETGVPNEGLYEVIFSAPGYNDQLFELNFITGEVLSVNIELSSYDIHQVELSVVKTSDLIGVSDVHLSVYNEDFNYDFISDDNGNVYTSLSEGEYFVSISSWGYSAICDTIIVSSQNIDFLFELNQAYNDNFSSDLGWEIQFDMDLTAGVWELGIPNATYYENELLNPGFDSEMDCGEQAFITGNQVGIEYYQGDVDDGATYLLSPYMDLSDYVNPYLSFETWFVNSGGSGVPNDSLLIKISNVDETVLIDFRTSSSSDSEWKTHEIAITDYINLSDSMRLIVEVMDQASTGHLVEAGFDNFSIIDSELDINESQKIMHRLYPNPSFSGNVNIEVPQASHIAVHDLTGKCVYEEKLSRGVNDLNLIHLNPGVYLIKLQSENINESYLWIRE